MESINGQIATILNQCKAEIQAAMDAKGINASGRTSNSLQVQTSDKGVRLVLAGKDHAPLETLEIGRAGGRVPRNFTDIIYQWSLDKGLQWGTDRERRRIAGAVAWGKIRHEGTDRHKTPVEVYSQPVKKARTKLQEDIRIAIAAMLRTANTNF